MSLQDIALIRAVSTRASLSPAKTGVAKYPLDPALFGLSRAERMPVLNPQGTVRRPRTIDCCIRICSSVMRNPGRAGDGRDARPRTGQLHPSLPHHPIARAVHDEFAIKARSSRAFIALPILL